MRCEHAPAEQCVGADRGASVVSGIARPLNLVVSRHQHMPRSRVKLELYEPIGPYSHAVVAGGQIFISGTAGIDPTTGALAGEDTYSQTRQVLRNIQSILGAAGATLDDIA